MGTLSWSALRKTEISSASQWRGMNGYRRWGSSARCAASTRLGRPCVGTSSRLPHHRAAPRRKGPDEPCAQAVLAGYVRDAGRFTIGLPPRGKLSAKRTDEGGVNRCRPFTGNCGGLALIRPCGATFPRGGRLGATHSHTPGSRPGTRSASGADARCRHRSCGLCRPGHTPWRGYHRRRASADAPG